MSVNYLLVRAQLNVGHVVMTLTKMAYLRFALLKICNYLVPVSWKKIAVLSLHFGLLYVKEGMHRLIWRNGNLVAL